MNHYLLKIINENTNMPSNTNFTNVHSTKWKSPNQVQEDNFDQIHEQLVQANEWVKDLSIPKNKTKRNSNNVSSWLVKRKIHGLSSQQISLFSKNQIRALSKAEIVSFKFWQIAAFTPQQIQTIKIKRLTCKQIRVLTKQQIQALMLEQVCAFKKNQIQALTKAQVNYLTPQQITWITPQQITWITPQQITWFSKEQIYNTHWLKTQVLTKQQIQALTKQQIQVLTQEQIQTFKPWQVQAFTEKQTSWFKTEQTSFFAKESQSQWNFVNIFNSSLILVSWIVTGSLFYWFKNKNNKKIIKKDDTSEQDCQTSKINAKKFNTNNTFNKDQINEFHNLINNNAFNNVDKYDTLSIKI